MIITCPDCATRYTVDADVFPLTGRTVKCARCATTWYALPTQEQDAPADEPAAAAEPQAGPSTSDDAAPDAAGAADPEAYAADDPEADEDDGPQTVVADEDLDWTDASAVSDDAEPSGGELVVADPNGGIVAEDEEVVFSDEDAPGSEAAEAEGGFGAGEEPEAAVIVDDAPQEDEGDALPESVNSIELASRARAAARRFMGKSRTARERTTGERVKAMAVGGMAAALVAGFVYRENVVRQMPSLAGLYASIGYEVNLRGLTFEDVHPSQAIENGIPVLRVEGAIRNVTGSEIAVPPVRLSLNAANGQEIYYWTIQPDAKALKPGEAISFNSVLSAPPSAASAVGVRFVEPDRMRLGMTN